MLLKKTTKLHQKDFSRNYYGRPDYEEVKDSIEIGGNLPLGAYLMEVTSDNTGIAPQRRTLLCQQSGGDDPAVAG